MQLQNKSLNTSSNKQAAPKPIWKEILNQETNWYSILP